MAAENSLRMFNEEYQPPEPVQVRAESKVDTTKERQTHCSVVELDLLRYVCKKRLDEGESITVKLPCGAFLSRKQ